MFNSQYYTCEQIDQRLLQGYLDDYNSQNDTNLTKDQFLTLLFNTIGRNSTVDSIKESIDGNQYNFSTTLPSAMAYTIPFIFVAGKKYVITNNSLTTVVYSPKIYNGDTLVQQGMEIGEEFECLANGTKLYLWVPGTDLNVTIRTCGITDELNNIKQAIEEEDAKINNNTVQITSVQKEAVYDVSAHNDNAVFESLQALLSSSNLNTLIPTSVRCGGMSIRFIQGSVPNTDQYVQYRLMSDTFSTTESDWQGVDDELTAGSNNLVKSGGVYPIKESIDGSQYNFSTTLSSSVHAYTFNYAFKKGKKYIVKDNSVDGTLNTPRIYDDVGAVQDIVLDEIFECTANGTKLYGYYSGTEVNVSIMLIGISERVDTLESNIKNLSDIKDSIIIPNLKDIRYGEFELGIVENEYVRNDNGEFAKSNTNSRTSKLYIGGLDSLMYYNTNQYAYNAWYKKDGSFLSSFTLPSSSGKFNTLSVPDNAYYVAFSNLKAAMQDFVLKSDVGSILENRKSVEGSKKVSYQRTKSTSSTEVFDYIFTVGHTYLILWDFTAELRLYDNEDVVEILDSVNANEYYRFTPTKAATRFGGYVNRTGVINVLIWEYDGAEPISLYNNQRIDSIQSGSFDGNKSIKFYNQDKLSALYAATTTPLPNIVGSRDKVYLPLIAITTDIHTDFEGLKRIYQYADEIPQIVCSLMLGDACQSDINDLNETLADELWNTYNKPIFRIIGNHEAQQGRLQEPPSLSDITNLLYSDDIVAHNGETHAYSKSPYWYYDLQYPNSNHKLRIIGLCQYFDPSVGTAINTFSQEQMTWFCNTLESADENTYVIVLTHTSIGSHITEDTYNDVFSVSNYLFHAHGWDKTHSIIIPEIIDAWMYGKSIEHTDDLLSFSHTFNGNNATKFVCYLTGHEHWDDVHYVKEFPKQICIVSDCTNNIDFQQWGDISKTSGGKNRDSFNLFSFDPYNRHINLIKIGGDITKDMRERKFTNFALPSI